MRVAYVIRQMGSGMAKAKNHKRRKPPATADDDSE